MKIYGFPISCRGPYSADARPFPQDTLYSNNAMGMPNKHPVDLAFTATESSVIILSSFP